MHSTLVSLATLAAASATPLMAPQPASGCSLTVYPPHSPDDASPLLAARDRVRQLLRSGAQRDIVVCLQPGTYHHAVNTLSLTHEDDTCFSAPDVAACRARGDAPRVVWRSVVPGAAIISGGVQLTGWQPITLGGGAAYVAAVPQGTFSAGFTARSLWVAQTRASRTISTATDVLGTLTAWVSRDNLTVGYIAGGGVPPSFLINNTNLIEFTWPIAIANWIAPRCTIASISGSDLTLASPCGAFLLQRSSGKGHAVPPAPVTVEAAPSFPLSAGTFYHDAENDVLYYALADGQSPADLEADALGSNAPVHAPTLLGVAAGSLEPAGAVRVESSSDISFIGCNFTHIAAVYALSVTDGSQRVVVDGCRFTDLSGGFLKLGNVSTTHAGSADESDWDSGSVISNNVADDMAVEYGGAAGLFAGYLFNASISHNDVSDAGYSGFSIGWGWGTAFPPGVGNNTVEGNRVYNVMRVLRDGGGIYVNGATNGSWPSVIRGNWVDHDNAVYAVYYLDNGASHWLVTDNVASNAPLAWAFFMQGCCKKPALNSRVENFWYAADEMLAPQNNCAAENCTVDAATVFNVTGGAWPPEAMAIMNATGPQ